MRPNLKLWIPGAILGVVLAAGAAAVARRQAAEPARSEPRELRAVRAPAVRGEVEGAVRGYLDACGAPRPAPADPAALQACIRRLASSLDALARSDTAESLALEQSMAELRRRCDIPERGDADSAPYARWAREVFIAGTEVMEQLRRSRYAASPEVEHQLAEVRQGAQGLRNGVPLAEQHAEVARYLHEAGVLLTLMSGPP